jgi:hypothetical protein
MESKNKAVVRRFWTDVIVGGDLDALDQVVAPEYRSLDKAGDDLGRLKDAIATALAMTTEQRFDELAMAAEGESVFAMVDYSVTLPDGTTKTDRGILYYRIVDGRIVENMMASQV